MPTLNLIIDKDPRAPANRPYVQNPNDWRVYRFDEVVRPYNGRVSEDDENSAYTLIRQIARANLDSGLNVAVIAPFDSLRYLVEFVNPLTLYPQLHGTEDGSSYQLELPVTIIVTKSALVSRGLIEKFNKRGR